MKKKLMQLPSSIEKRKFQIFQSGILTLSSFIMVTSADLVKAEQPSLNIINASALESSEYLNNFPSHTLASDLLLAEKNVEETQIDVIKNFSLETSESTSSIPSNTLADDSLNPKNDDVTTDSSLEQINNVTQFTDVTSQEWAYEALRNLVEKYKCISAYPDGTFKGDRALTRYEFASLLNTCLEKMQELISANRDNLIEQDDLTVIQKLQNDFKAELSTLQQRIDKLDNQTTALQNNQFSTTVLMGGEVIFAAAQAFGGDPPGTGKSNATLNYLARLQLVSSFTGKDRLRLELSTGNFEGFGFADPQILNTNAALLSYQTGYDNQLQLSSLEYRFATLGERAVFTIKPVGFSLSNVLSPNSPYFDTGRGAISRFGEANPVFKIGALDAGVGLDYLLNRSTRLQLAYGVRNGNNPETGAFLQKGAHAAGMQFLFLPGNDVITGISYIYSYSPDGRLNTFTGSAIADASGFINQSANIHALSGTLRWRITPNLTFATWGGLVGTYAARTNAFAVSSNYMFSLGLTEPFGRRGDLFAVMFGQQPRLISVGEYAGANGGLLEDASSYHIETFYNLAVSDRVTITPGFFLVTNPGNIDTNNTIYVGVLRTTFRF